MIAVPAFLVYLALAALIVFMALAISAVALVVAILADVRKLSALAREGGEGIAEGISTVREYLSLAGL